MIIRSAPRVLPSEHTSTGRIAALEEENNTLKAQLEKGKVSLQEARDYQKALEDSLSVAEKNLECLRQDISRLQHSHRRSETAVSHYRSKAKLLGASLGEVVNAVKRVEGQQNKKLPEPPKMI